MGGLGGSKAGLGDMGRLGLSDNRLGMGLFDQKPNHPPHHIQDSAGFSSKDWQDGLRALLPNVNVSFGQSGHAGLGNGLGNNGLANSSGPNTGHTGLGQHFGLQNNYQNSFSQERQLQQHNSNWGSSLSNGLGNDWTMLDPAIVTGQLANPLEPPVSHNMGRSDSPPNWITANLEQLTEGTGGPYQQQQQQQQNNLIPAFNGLGLG